MIVQKSACSKVLEIAFALVIHVLITCGIASAQQGNKLDLFVYVDKSVSVFPNFNVGSDRPADILVDKIRAILNVNIAELLGREGGQASILSDGGSFRLYGFAGLKAGATCTASLEEYTSSDPDALRAAEEKLANYQVQGEDYLATDFKCLFRQIAENSTIEDSIRDGRVPVVLIASDFLHDPNDDSSADPNSEGICATLDHFKRTEGKIPPKLAKDYQTLVRFQKDPLLNLERRTTALNANLPIFGVLRLKYPGNGTKSYSRCAIEMTRPENAFLAKRLVADLGASDFELETGTALDFANTFIREAISQISEKPSIQEVADVTSQYGRPALKLVMKNPLPNDEITTVRALLTQRGRTQRVVFEQAIAPGEQSAELSIEIPRGLSRDGEVVDVVMEYRAGRASNVSKTEPYRLELEKPENLTVGASPILLSAEAGTTELKLIFDNPNASDIEITSISFGRKNQIAQNLPLSGKDSVGANQTNRQIGYRLPERITQSLSPENEYVALIKYNILDSAKEIEISQITVEPPPTVDISQAKLTITFDTPEDPHPVLFIEGLRNNSQSVPAIIDTIKLKPEIGTPLVTSLREPLRIDPSAVSSLEIDLSPSDLAGLRVNLIKDLGLRGGGMEVTLGTDDVPNTSTNTSFAEVEYKSYGFQCSFAKSIQNGIWDDEPNEDLVLKLPITISGEKADTRFAIPEVATISFGGEIAEVGVTLVPSGLQGSTHLVEIPFNIDPLLELKSSIGNSAFEVVLRGVDGVHFCSERDLIVFPLPEDENWRGLKKSGSMKPLVDSEGDAYWEVGLKHSDIGAVYKIEDIKLLLPFGNEPSIDFKIVSDSNRHMRREELNFVEIFSPVQDRSRLKDAKIRIEYGAFPPVILDFPELISNIEVARATWHSASPRLDVRPYLDSGEDEISSAFVARAPTSSPDDAVRLDLPQAQKFTFEQAQEQEFLISFQVSDAKLEEKYEILGENKQVVCLVRDGEEISVCGGREESSRWKPVTPLPLTGLRVSQVSYGGALRARVENAMSIPIKIDKIELVSPTTDRVTSLEVKPSQTILPGESARVTTVQASDREARNIIQGVHHTLRIRGQHNENWEGLKHDELRVVLQSVKEDDFLDPIRFLLVDIPNWFARSWVEDRKVISGSLRVERESSQLPEGTLQLTFHKLGLAERGYEDTRSEHTFQLVPDELISKSKPVNFMFDVPNNDDSGGVKVLAEILSVNGARIVDEFDLEYQKKSRSWSLNNVPQFLAITIPCFLLVYFLLRLLGLNTFPPLNDLSKIAMIGFVFISIVIFWRAPWGGDLFTLLTIILTVGGVVGAQQLLHPINEQVRRFWSSTSQSTDDWPDQNRRRTYWGVGTLVVCFSILVLFAVNDVFPAKILKTCERQEQAGEWMVKLDSNMERCENA